MLTPKTFATFQVVTATTVILENMPELTGGLLYSTRVLNAANRFVKELETYDRTMLKRGIWNGGEECINQTGYGAETVSKLMYAILSISTDQPLHVQERFDRELEELLIRYGVNIAQLERS